MSLSNLPHCQLKHHIWGIMQNKADLIMVCCGLTLVNYIDMINQPWVYIWLNVQDGIWITSVGWMPALPTSKYFNKH